MVLVGYKSAKAEIGKIPNCESVLKVPKHLWCLLNCASNDHPMSSYLRFFHKFAAVRHQERIESSKYGELCGKLRKKGENLEYVD